MPRKNKGKKFVPRGMQGYQDDSDYSNGSENGSSGERITRCKSENQKKFNRFSAFEEELVKEAQNSSGSNESTEANSFFSVRSNPFDLQKQTGKIGRKQRTPREPELEDYQPNPPRKTSSDNYERLRFEYNVILEQLSHEKEVNKELANERNSLKMQCANTQNKLNQLQAGNNKAKCLEAHNAQLKLRMRELEIQNQEIPLLQEKCEGLQWQLKEMQNEVNILRGVNIETLTLEQCLELMNEVSRSLNTIHTQIRVKSDAVLELSRCVVCLTNDRTELLVPCGHFALCEMCAGAVNSCPICRCKVKSRVKVHVA